MPTIKESKENAPSSATSTTSNQTSAPVWMNTPLFQGPVKHAGRNHQSRPIIPASETDIQVHFRSSEPYSPEVSCLGRVRVKRNHGENKEPSDAPNPPTRYVPKGKNPSIQMNLSIDRIYTSDEVEQSFNVRYVSEAKNPSIQTNQVTDRANTSDELKQTSNLRGRNRATQMAGCLARRKRKEASKSVSSTETTMTRRERAAVLARSLTDVMENLRRLEQENSDYMPAVPPPNSLLLMRGSRDVNKQSLRGINSTAQENGFVAEEMKNRGAITSIESMHKARNDSTKQATPISGWGLSNINGQNTSSEIEPSSLVKGDSLANLKSDHVDRFTDCRQELSLWQRRAIPKLDAIDTKQRFPVTIQGPSTN
ncbi:hypothetical protein KP509_07G012200 [Ceratopteris richardii]|nr:hypothetical protein KP509_07G012200 [Ceratopteris richardii]